MDDKRIFAAMRLCLSNGLQAMGLNDVAVLRLSQKAKANSDTATQPMTLYMAKIMDQRIGYPERVERYRPESDDFLHCETICYESTVQISAQFDENLDDEDGLTPSDLLNRAAHILQSDAGIGFLRSQGLMPLRVGAFHNPSLSNDTGQFEASPSFHIILAHKQTVESVIPAAQTITGTFDNGYKY